MVERCGPPGTPLTTAEIAAEFDCAARPVAERLEALVDEGELETKELRPHGRVWWRPVSTPTPSARTPSGRSAPGPADETRAQRVRSNGEVTDPARGVDRQVNAEQARRESEQRLRLATAIGGIDVWELDLRNNESPVRSPRHDEIFGYDEPIDDWGVERFLGHVVSEDRDRIERSFAESLRTGVWAFECRIVRADGQQRWIAARGKTFDDDAGQPRRALGVVQDVTDRKRRERELERRRGQLERQNERLEGFTSTVTHDLRSPLAAIGGRLDLYRRTGEDEHLDVLEETLERAERLVDDLLTVAGQGELVEITHPTDVGAVFEQAREGTLPESAGWEYEPVPTVLADRDRLLQLFENVLRNSVDHGGSDVTVRVGPLPEGRGFYIEDDGPGFAGVDPGRLFESGYASREGGTGFGLSIVQSVADAHGWGISVGTEASGGARLEVASVEFPADP
jgi:PAS domain S-box-containing protein